MSLAFLQVMPVREEEFDTVAKRARGGRLGIIRAADYKPEPMTSDE